MQIDGFVAILFILTRNGYANVNAAFHAQSDTW